MNVAEVSRAATWELAVTRVVVAVAEVEAAVTRAAATMQAVVAEVAEEVRAATWV